MAPAGYLAQSDVTGNACDSWRRVLGSGDHKRLGFPVRDPQGQKKETETPDSDAGSMKARGKNVEEITPSLLWGQLHRTGSCLRRAMTEESDRLCQVHGACCEEEWGFSGCSP